MTTKTESTVRSELKKLDPKRYQLIREFYYKIADALPQLAEELEFADLDIINMQADPDAYHEHRESAPLLDQHFIICEMMDTFKGLKLGEYL